MRPGGAPGRGRDGGRRASARRRARAAAAAGPRSARPPRPRRRARRRRRSRGTRAARRRARPPRLGFAPPLLDACRACRASPPGQVDDADPPAGARELARACRRSRARRRRGARRWRGRRRSRDRRRAADDGRVLRREERARRPAPKSPRRGTIFAKASAAPRTLTPSAVRWTTLGMKKAATAATAASPAQRMSSLAGSQPRRSNRPPTLTSPQSAKRASVAFAGARSRSPRKRIAITAPWRARTARRRTRSGRAAASRRTCGRPSACSRSLRTARRRAASRAP